VLHLGDQVFYLAPGDLVTLRDAPYRRPPAREWAPAVEAAGVATPARIHDLRSTYASNSLAAGIDVFELARIMGTSIDMIERHYGTLLTGAAAGIAERQAAFEAEQELLRGRCSGPT
jgi:integrase